MSSCAIVIPIYKPGLDEMEQFSLDYSLARLTAGEPVISLRRPRWMSRRLHDAPWRGPGCFADEYSRPFKATTACCCTQASTSTSWITSSMLILQTDAVLLRDELDDWCAKPHDYVGAPLARWA